MDFGGLAIEADQFQLPNGVVLGEDTDPMSTTVNITIDRVIISKAVFKMDDCPDTEEETPEPLEEPEE